MTDDDYVHAPDSGSGQQRGTEAASRGVSDHGNEKACGAAQGEAEGSKAVSLARSKELKDAAKVLEGASDEELEAAGMSGLVSMESREASYSGMLPAPEYFAAYRPDVQERICRWNDAFTIDESKRQDKLVDNEIKQQRAASIMTFMLILVFAVLSFGAFIVTRDPNSFWLLSVPVVNVIGNLIKPAFSKSSRG